MRKFYLSEKDDWVWNGKPGGEDICNTCNWERYNIHDIKKLLL